MADFSDLPLEIVQLILELAVTPPLDVFRRVLNLRLVNRLFDQEVMPLIGKLDVLRHESVRCRTIPWHHPNDGTADLLESGALFLARYVLDRPRDQSPWWANMSTMLNHMVDTVLSTLQSRGQPLDIDNDDSSRGRRLSMLTSYCRWILNRPDQRVRCISRFDRDEELSGIPGNPPWFLVCPVDERDYQWVVDLAWTLFGPLQSDGLDETLVNNAIRMATLDVDRNPIDLLAIADILVCAGNASLFRDIVPYLRGPFDVNGPRHQYLKRAAISGRRDMVRAVLDPPRGPPHKRYGLYFEGAIALAIRCRQPDMAWFLLGLAVPHPRDEYGESRVRLLLHYGLREACRLGYTDLVAHILETERAEGYDCWWLEFCRTPLEMACGAGNEEAVRLLLEAGVDPRGCGSSHGEDDDVPSGDMLGHHVFSTGSMFAAAVGGHVGVAGILVDAGFPIEEAEWHLVARGAIECGQAAFLGWMLTQEVFCSTDEGWVGEQFDILGEACVWGNADILRTLDAHGFLLNRPVWALGLGPAPYVPVDPDDDSGPIPGHQWFFPNDRDASLLRFGSQPPCLRFESPLLAAMSWSRVDIAAFLVSLGWAPIKDILIT